jgi:hypothetical protein
MAERVGFEPTVRDTGHQQSKPASIRPQVNVRSSGNAF